MTTVEFVADIVGLLSESYPPFGWEDQYQTETVRDKTAITESATVPLEENFNESTAPLVTKRTKTGETQKRRKGNPWHRFVMDGKGPDLDLIAQSIEYKMFGCLKNGVRIANTSYSGLSLSDLQRGLVRIVVDNVELPKGISDEPMPILVRMIGPGNPSQWQYWDVAPKVIVRGRVLGTSKNDAESMKSAMMGMIGLRIGAKQRGVLRDIRISKVTP